MVVSAPYCHRNAQCKIYVTGNTARLILTGNIASPIKGRKHVKVVREYVDEEHTWAWERVQVKGDWRKLHTEKIYDIYSSTNSAGITNQAGWDCVGRKNARGRQTQHFSERAWANGITTMT
jgi:hypothetical protein